MDKPQAWDYEIRQAENGHGQRFFVARVFHPGFAPCSHGGVTIQYLVAELKPQCGDWVYVGSYEYGCYPVEQSLDAAHAYKSEESAQWSVEKAITQWRNIYETEQKNKRRLL